MTYVYLPFCLLFVHVIRVCRTGGNGTLRCLDKICVGFDIIFNILLDWLFAFFSMNFISHMYTYFLFFFCFLLCQYSLESTKLYFLFILTRTCILMRLFSSSFAMPIGKHYKTSFYRFSFFFFVSRLFYHHRCY